MKHEQASPEYLTMAAAQATYDAADDATILDAISALEIAERPYCDAANSAKAKWDAIPACEAKDSAEMNADDMMYTEKLIPQDDKLGWLRAAISTYELNF